MHIFVPVYMSRQQLLYEVVHYMFLGSPSSMHINLRILTRQKEVKGHTQGEPGDEANMYICAALVDVHSSEQNAHVPPRDSSCEHQLGPGLHHSAIISSFPSCR